jgi:hypothetical protein
MNPPSIQVTNEMISLGFWIVCLIGFVQLIVAATQIYYNVRRQPPADQTFSTKDEMIVMKSDLQAQIGIMDDRNKERFEEFRRDREQNDEATRHTLTALQATVQQGFLDVNRSIGRLEGINEAKEALTKTMRDLMADKR